MDYARIIGTSIYLNLSTDFCAQYDYARFANFGFLECFLVELGCVLYGDGLDTVDGFKSMIFAHLHCLF